MLTAEVGFDVEYISPISWPSKDVDPMDTLILGNSDKDVIKSLARKYSRREDTWGADFIAGKGEGQVCCVLNLEKVTKDCADILATR